MRGEFHAVPQDFHHYPVSGHRCSSNSTVEDTPFPCSQCTPCQCLMEESFGGKSKQSRDKPRGRTFRRKCVREGSRKGRGHTDAHSGARVQANPTGYRASVLEYLLLLLLWINQDLLQEHLVCLSRSIGSSGRETLSPSNLLHWLVGR